jgi:two-component system chemotaxis response regulator CheY
MVIKLVLADDAPFIRDILRHIFDSQPGYEVIGEAEDGDQAVQLALGTQPHVVLMDIVMPKKSGIEATQEILRGLPHCRVIACSTIDQEHMVLRALEAGCCSYIVKPFKAEEVLKAVRSAVKTDSKKQEKG